MRKKKIIQLEPLDTDKGKRYYLLRLHKGMRSDHGWRDYFSNIGGAGSKHIWFNNPRMWLVAKTGFISWRWAREEKKNRKSRR